MKRLIILMTLLPIACWAADKDSRFRVIDIDAYRSCGLYMLAREACKEGSCYSFNAFNQWLAGYITAANTFIDDTFDIAQNENIASLDLWIDNYCKNHPRKNFSDAIHSLVTEFYSARIQAEPKK